MFLNMDVGKGQADEARCRMQVGMDVEAVRAHFKAAQGGHARRPSALAIRTRSGVAVNIWRTYGAAHAPVVRLTGAWPDAWVARFTCVCNLGAKEGRRTGSYRSSFQCLPYVMLKARGCWVRVRWCCLLQTGDCIWPSASPYASVVGV